MSDSIVALVSFFNEERYLPGWFENLRGRVDAVVALDDGSTDGSAAIAASQPETVRLLRVAPEAKRGWDEPTNRRLLVRAGQEVGADWFLTIDADERVEDRFFDDLDAVTAWADREDVVACSFRLRELWDSPLTYRVDGVWGDKTKAAFFRNLGEDHHFDDAAWHGEWVPMQVWQTPRCRTIPYDLYHLKMIDPPDRLARRRRYEELDPHGDFQPVGYRYLTDERGLRLERVSEKHRYRGMPRPNSRS